ncbi:MAG: hypothetical protein E6J91_06405, partial [Deltaproteobacteria bacterium]
MPAEKMSERWSIGSGDAEVDELDLARVRHQDVLRRHVAVDDAERAAGVVALPVRVVERRGDLLADERAHVERHLDVLLGG